MPTVDYALGPERAAEFQSLYGTYDWWADRTEKEVKRALAGTDETIVLREDESEDIVAAARVLTDYTFYAMVFDVIVHEKHRGRGLGSELMAGVVAHPALAGVNPTLLAREGLVEFYESCGFDARGAIEHPDGDPEPLRFLVYSRDEDTD